MGKRDAEMVINNLNAIHSLAREKGTKTFAVTIPESGFESDSVFAIPTSFLTELFANRTGRKDKLASPTARYRQR